MPVKRHAVELSEQIDRADAAVNAVTDRDINQPVLACDRDCGLGAILCKGLKTSSCTTAENQTNCFYTHLETPF